MPRRQKKYHYIYKTTCLVTGKFYVGMHSTDDLDDGYLGSGKILGYSRKKHGDENHKKEILEMCPSREVLKLREKEIVNEELLADPLNINLKYGGEGGWDHINDSGSYTHSRNLGLIKGRETQSKFPGKLFDARSRGGKIASTREKFRASCIGSFKGKQHSSETKSKIASTNSEKQRGCRNSQYGTCWVNNELGEQKILLALLEKYLSLGFTRGRCKK